jgi:methionyl aminopeptidase
MKDWIKAGEIAGEVREFGKKLIKPGKSHREVTEKIEAKILELNGELAFPTQMSLNNVAAHYTSLADKDFNFKEGDIIKLDVGVHVNGAIGDTALTVDLGNNSKLIKASQNALKAALDIVKPGVSLGEIGKTIQDEITALSFAPVKNLGGHGLDRYQIHTSPTVPNFDNKDSTKLERGQKIAIEPFASSGRGLIIEGNPSEIYQIVNPKNLRNPNGRKILQYVTKKYKTLPFAKRQLLGKFNKLEVATGLLALKREGILHEFGTLPEKVKDSLVSQAEHSVIVGEKVTTRI